VDATGNPLPADQASAAVLSETVRHLHRVRELAELVYD
jgi:hypothetical protein